MKTVSERAGQLAQLFGVNRVPADDGQIVELDSELLDMVAGAGGEKGGRSDSILA